MKEKGAAAEGFKVWLHELKIRAEFTAAVLLVTTLISAAAWGWWTWRSFPVWARVNLKPYLVAEFRVFSGIGLGQPVYVWLPDRGWEAAFALDVVKAWRPFYIRAGKKATKNALITLIFGSFIGFLALGKYFLKKAERELYRENVVRGAGLLSARELSSRLQGRHGKGRIKISREITLPRKLETRHVFVIGMTGTGKSVFLANCLEKIRNEKAIIFDLKGEFCQKFWRKGDLILNPFDRRTLRWSILNDVFTFPQAYELAASFIPSAAADGVEKYFRDAARDVLAGILAVCRKRGMLTNQEIWKVISSGPMKIALFLEGTEEGAEGAAHLVKPDSNQAAGIISTLVQFTRVLKFMPDGDFSVRSWSREDGQEFLYLVVPPQKKELYAPLVSAVMNLAIKEILSLPDDLERRRFFILDELGAMQKISAFVDALTLGRSKGISMFVGIQDFGRIDTLYGRAIRETIWNNCITRVVLRVNAPDTLEYLSRALSEVEIEEGRKGFALGAEDERDTLNVTRSKSRKRLVLPVEIQELADLNAFIQIENLPPARDEIPFKKRKARVEPFEMEEAAIEPEPEEAKPEVEPEAEEKKERVEEAAEEEEPKQEQEKEFV